MYSNGNTSPFWTFTGSNSPPIYLPYATTPFLNNGYIFTSIHILTFTIIINTSTDSYIWSGRRRITAKKLNASPYTTSIVGTPLVLDGGDTVDVGITGQSLGISLVASGTGSTSFAFLGISATSTTPNVVDILCQGTLESHFSNLG